MACTPKYLRRQKKLIAMIDRWTIGKDCTVGRFEWVGDVLVIEVKAK